MVTKIEAIIFDLDDTIHDFTLSERSAREVTCNEVARRYGVSQPEVFQAYRSINSRVIDEWLAQKRFETSTLQEFRELVWTEALQSLGYHPSSDEVAGIASAHEENRLQFLQLYPDTLGCLDWVNQHWPIGLISNGGRDSQRKQVTCLGLTDYFRVMLFEIQVLVLSFPHSNAGFAFPLPSQNRECFLEGLKRLFERIGGAPQRLRFDNLSAAVVRVGQGEAREVHETFRRFALHYRFEAEFCNPGKGNEEMAERLWSESVADMERPHYAKGELITTLWEEDKKALLALPRVPFEVDRLDRATLNNYAQFRWENHTYEAPQGRPGMPVLLRVFWDRIEVRDSQQGLLTTLQRQYMLKEEEIDWAAYFEIYTRRPRAVTQAARFVHLPEAVQRFLKEATSETRASRVRLVRDMVQKHPMSRIAQALDELPAERSDDRASLELKLYMLDPENALPEPLAEEHTPPQLRGKQTEATLYDCLTPGRERGETDECRVAQRAV